MFCPVSYTTRQCFQLEIYVYSRQLQLGIAKKSAGDNNLSLIDDVLYYLTNADNLEFSKIEFSKYEQNPDVDSIL